MPARFFAVLMILAGVPLLGRSQDRPVIIVHPFALRQGLPWPYDMHQLAMETMAELQRKDGKYFEITLEPLGDQRPSYSLDGEVTDWRPGNRATRMLVGMGSGRETAKIHYWLTDEHGKKVFEHTDTIRAAFWGNEYAASVGQLALPFADKIAGRIAGAKLR